MQITEAMVAAGIAEFKQELPSTADDMLEYYDGDETELDNKISDLVVFIFQAMIQAHNKGE